jgi:hypothetical protein
MRDLRRHRFSTVADWSESLLNERLERLKYR